MAGGTVGGWSWSSRMYKPTYPGTPSTRYTSSYLDKIRRCLTEDTSSICSRHHCPRGPVGPQ
ncbi:uncharacterized protein GLRG_11283 [Colletotrichum graminicola M1.001]|uniref:Uncharacterized protein n=1 Tax=Colletotrichum graminicola (strain M1.001 / M2 / FGSC 10212) TaxID=645133 RepID=E3QZ51_COLGM|nr:uncharacterized protein GLRG_11283 [Colletotrichum graminicola M1.001]EFQ36139.1 hypothetical protein GLRG_11283 [Colletotrichum graminicola M1.001]